MSASEIKHSIGTNIFVLGRAEYSRINTTGHPVCHRNLKYSLLIKFTHSKLSFYYQNISK